VPRHQLAQLNIVKMKYAIDDPGMPGLFVRMDDINRLVDAAPGFVWRLQIDDDDVAAITFFGDDCLPNMSVWENLASLHGFVYRSSHSEVMALRKQWFERMVESYSVLWWIAEGQLPVLEEASERLECLRELGPGARAFSFKQAFDPQ
jgi:hypothetical protein